MTRFLHTLTGCRRGVAGIETAMVLTTFFALLFGMFDLSRMVGWQHVLDRSVLTAVRYAAVNSSSATTSSITAAFTTAATPLLGAATAGQAKVTVTFTPSYATGNAVTVSARLAWAPATGLTQFIALTLTSSATMTVLH